MRAGAGLGWRLAAAAAFGATAALAVVLSRGAPVDAALTSAKGGGGPRPPAAARAAVTAPCALQALRISLGAGVRISAATVRYPVDFTSVSPVPCTLAGYPRVTAYRGDRVQVGAAAGRAPSAVRGVVLARGQTAHSDLDVSAPAVGCGPVRAAGLRVVAPGQASARYVGHTLTTCADRARRGRDYLLVHAIEPGAAPVAGSRPAAATAVHARTPAPG